MKTIVLITRENSRRATHVSVFLCSSYSEAKHFCNFVNRLSLAGEDKLAVRKIAANAEYPLEKYQPFRFDDFIKVDDRKIQHVLRELDSQILAVALIDAQKEVKDYFFRNMSKRAACMLAEEIEFWGPVTESDIENARQVILDIYDELTMENKFDEAWARYKNLKEDKTGKQEDIDVENHMVLVFRGVETAADFLSVYLFDEYDSADYFCNYLNSLKQDKGSFIYAMHADQMIEYETTKPLLTSFDQIFKFERLHGEFNGALIIREALKKFDSHTILKAFKGMDKRYRMFIMQNLPTKTTDEINEIIERSDYADLCSSRDSHQAQQRILNAINKTADKFKQGKFPLQVTVIKD